MKPVRGFEFIREYRDSGLNLPTRSTQYSAGYDLASTGDFCLRPGETIVIPTGVKAYMQPDEYLGIHIRSSLAIKHGLYLVNSQGIIDADYYDNPENEGQIFIALGNRGNREIMIERGMRIAQGVFCRYLLTDQEEGLPKDARVGGIGSTGS